MKFAKKFLNDLKEIGRLSFFEKNLWVGKSVPEIICDNLEKRGITHEDFTGAVVLTVEEASNIWEHLINYESSIEENEGSMSFKHLEVRDSVTLMRKRIKQAESQND